MDLFTDGRDNRQSATAEIQNCNFVAQLLLMAFASRLVPVQAGAAGQLDFSAAAEADSEFAAFDDHRNMPAALGQAEHSLQAIRIFEDIDIIEGDLATGEILTGSRGIGSKVLTVNLSFFVRHDLSSPSP